MHENFHKGFAINITLAMLFALVVGFLLFLFPEDDFVKILLVDDLFDLVGKIFIILIKMMVVPIVFVSLVCGVSSLTDTKRLGKMSILTIFLYLATTACAITLALTIATSLDIGKGVGMTNMASFVKPIAPTYSEVVLNLFPDNPFKALVNGEMLQIIIFSLILGGAIVASGDSGKRVAGGFQDMNRVMINLVLLIMRFAPLGVFCLLAAMIAKSGFNLIAELFGYFFTVLLVLFIQLIVTYGIMLLFFTNITFHSFLKKMSSAMLFAFSVSSSNASIPVVMQTARDKLNLSESVVSFVIPLGSTINMDGTAIMQGVATVFIANAYNIDITLSGYISVVLMATIASIGTAGVPGVGLVTLAMVLSHVGLPVEGIAMIIAVDRILDMARTAINITGDCTVACVVENFFQKTRAKAIAKDESIPQA
ncbi:MAG: dicarboxylate/amino acid:cation symporter [Pseudomonadota bacterium]|nr:dicarboxylate/amino acid:cation symporter [Pseudomonadota bacterium]